MQTNGHFTVLAGAAIEDKCRVMPKAGSTTSPLEMVLADETQVGVGIAQYYVPEGDVFAVRPNNHSGTHEVVAAGPINAGDSLFAAAAGRVANTGSVPLGAVALSTATAEGHHITLIYT